MRPPPQAFLTALFDAALGAVDPRRRLAAELPRRTAAGRLIVVGAGKAAAAMALAAAEHYGHRVQGVVVTREGYGLRPGEDAGRIRVLEASHPIPGELSLRAADAILHQVAHLAPADLVVCLLSGGGSALMERPAHGLSLNGLRSITAALLKSGASIGEINTVRKHLSLIKGGHLALSAWPARVETFAISDVPGDDPSLIASGPTVADPSTLGEAMALLRRHGVELEPSMFRSLADGALETPKLGDPRLANSRFRLIGSPRDALAAAAKLARANGCRILDLGDAVEGEASAVAGIHAEHAARAALTNLRTVILSGGELTVTHQGASGSGGPNREYALALAIALNGRPGVWALAADTDGIDGTPDAAGAFIGPDTLARAAASDLDPAGLLAAHDSGGLFKAMGDDFVTGPVRNNVADFRAILVDGAGLP